MGNRVLVTGGAGFIGSNLVDGLISAGHSVRIADNLSTGFHEFFEHQKIFLYPNVTNKR